MQFTNQPHQVEAILNDLHHFNQLLSTLRATDSNLAYSATALTIGQLLSNTLGQVSAGFTGWYLNARYQQTSIYQKHLEHCLNRYHEVAISGQNKQLMRNILNTIGPFIRPQDLRIVQPLPNNHHAASYSQQFIQYIWGPTPSHHERYIKPLSQRKTSDLIDYLLYGHYTCSLQQIVNMGLSR